MEVTWGSSSSHPAPTACLLSLSKLIIWITEKMHRNPLLLILAGEKICFIFLLWFLFCFYCTKPFLPPPLRSAGGQGTAHVNSEDQQRLWWLQWHIPGIILQERNSDGSRKKSAFYLECEPWNPAVTLKCTERVGAGILHPKLTELSGAWLGNSAPSCRREGIVKFLWLYSPRAAVAAVSGLGRRLDTDRAGKASMDWDRLRASSEAPADTCSGTWGQGTELAAS